LSCIFAGSGLAAEMDLPERLYRRFEFAGIVNRAWENATSS